MKKIKKIVCLVIAFLMTMSLIAVSVGATAPTTAPTYADAEDGALLYTADFSGDSDWNPSTDAAIENAGYEWTDSAYLQATADDQDSSKATFKHTKTINAAWGGDLENYPLADGYNYTIKFTITFVNTSQPIGLLFDGHYGAWFYPAKMRLRRNGSPLTGSSEKSFSVTSENKEFAIVVEGNAKYSVYVKGDNGGWSKLTDGAPTSDDGTFLRDNLGLYFYAYYDETEATFSNVGVYKGLADKNLISETPDETPDTPPVDSTLYDAANEGDILYTANFNGDSYWTPSAQNASQNAGWGNGHWPCDNITVTPDTTDPSKATIVLSSAANAAWGDDIEGLPLGADYEYTIKFTVVSTNGSKQGIGIFPDGQTGGYFWSTKARIQKGGGKVNDYVSFSGDRTAQDYAIEVDGYSIAIYAKIGDVWTLIDSVEDYYYDTETNKATFFNDNLCLYFYAYNAIDITVGDVNVYKGVSVLENKGELSPDDPDDSGSSSTPKPENKPPVLVEDETEEEPEIVEEKKGCGSSIGLSGVVLLVASVAGISAVSFRRKEDE